MVSAAYMRLHRSLTLIRMNESLPQMPDSITVFVVDGDQSFRRAMTRLMKAIGFRAVCLQSLDALLQENLPTNGAVILLDVHTARQFSATLQDPFKSGGLALPVIYLTDCDSDRTRREARQMGASGYFRKPVDEQALSDAITFAVRRKTNHEMNELTTVSLPSTE